MDLESDGDSKSGSLAKAKSRPRVSTRGRPVYAGSSTTAAPAAAAVAADPKAPPVQSGVEASKLQGVKASSDRRQSYAEGLSGKDLTLEACARLSRPGRELQASQIVFVAGETHNLFKSVNGKYDDYLEGVEGKKKHRKGFPAKYLYQELVSSLLAQTTTGDRPLRSTR